VPRLAPARLDRVLRVDQKQRVQTVVAREETRHARKKHVHVAVKAVMRRARMTNADAARRLAAKDVQRLAAKVVQRLAVKDVPRLAAKVVRRPAVKDVQRPAAKDVRRPAAKVVQRPAAKVARLPATKVALLPATKVVQHRVARAALEHGWKRPSVVAVIRSRLLRVVAQPSHRVHRDR
jgi:hypothetical protein